MMASERADTASIENFGSFFILGLLQLSIVRAKINVVATLGELKSDM
jgi:hypothetical protein